MDTICICGGIRALLDNLTRTTKGFNFCWWNQIQDPCKGWNSVDGIKSTIHISKQMYKLSSLDNCTGFDTDTFFFFKFMLYWTKQWPCPVQHEWILLVLVTTVSIDVLQYKYKYIVQIPQTLCVMTRPQCYQRRLLGYLWISFGCWKPQPLLEKFEALLENCKETTRTFAVYVVGRNGKCVLIDHTFADIIFVDNVWIISPKLNLQDDQIAASLSIPQAPVWSPPITQVGIKNDNGAVSPDGIIALKETL